MKFDIDKEIEKIEPDRIDKDNPYCFECGCSTFIENKQKNIIVCLKCGSHYDYYSA